MHGLILSDYILNWPQPMILLFLHILNQIPRYCNCKWSFKPKPNETMHLLHNTILWCFYKLHNRKLWSWRATISLDFQCCSFESPVAMSQLPIEIAQNPTIFTMVQEQAWVSLKTPRIWFCDFVALQCLISNIGPSSTNHVCNHNNENQTSQSGTNNDWD